MRTSTFRLCLLAPTFLLALAGAGMAQPPAAVDRANPARAVAAPPAACPPTPSEMTPDELQQGMRTARDRGFLWRISKGGRTSHLYGTIHLGQRDWLVPGPTVMRAVIASDVIAVEMNLEDPRVMQDFQASLTAAPRRPLPASLQRRLRAQADAACLPAEVNQLTPEMAAVTVTTLAAWRDGLLPAYAIDPVFMSMTRDGSRQVVSLESPAAQVQLLHGRTARETRDLVEGMVAGLESGDTRRGLVRQSQIWALSRHDELARYETWCECTKTASEREMNRRLLDERNPGLAQGIDALHAGGKTVFAAVGSLHMVGRHGLPALLEKRGYKVEQVVFGR